MDTILSYVRKVIDQSDRALACDYLGYYGIDESEAYRYADEFVEVCYQYNEETGEHEQRMPSELPFADVQYSDDGEFVTYSYGGCSETMPTKKFYDAANKLEKTML